MQQVNVKYSFIVKVLNFIYISDLKKFLRHNKDDWPKIVKKWTESSQVRLDELKSKDSSIPAIEIIKDWVVLCCPKGHELIEIDFDYQYPNCSSIIFEKWESFGRKIKDYFAVNIPKTETLLQDLKSENLKDGN